MNTTRHAITGSVLALVFCASSNASEPIYDGLGTYSRKIKTKSTRTQRYFDQGLALLHGFNHRGAIRSFQEAARLDPQCAMAHWGAALAAGPHINYPLVPPPMAELAWKELTLAKQKASNASEVERALIDALSKRYAYPQPEDRAPLDQAYADGMREVWKKFPNDVDVGALFAEAMMDLRPWNQWTLEGQPNPGTEEIIATLDAVLKLNPRHALNYDEPPSWMIPLRHTIGANLMRAGRFAEAEQVYRDDLKRLPENGWSLFGLSQALAAQEKDGAELEATRARFKKVWAKADVKITSSCLCRPGLTANCELNRTSTPPLLSGD